MPINSHSDNQPSSTGQAHLYFHDRGFPTLPSAFYNFWNGKTAQKLDVEGPSETASPECCQAYHFFFTHFRVSQFCLPPLPILTWWLFSWINLLPCSCDRILYIWKKASSLRSSVVKVWHIFLFQTKLRSQQVLRHVLSSKRTILHLAFLRKERIFIESHQVF